MNQSDASKGTQTCRWVITEHVFTVSWENTPRWVSIPTKTINHHPSVSLLSPSQSFHPALPHTSSQLSFSALCFWYLSHPLYPPMLFSLFLRRVGFPLPFALVLFIDYKEMTRSTRDCCASCPSSDVPCLFLSSCCPISIDNRNLSNVCEGRRCVCVFGSPAEKWKVFMRSSVACQFSDISLSPWFFSFLPSFTPVFLPLTPVRHWD